MDGELPNGVQLIGTTLWVGEDNGGDADHYQAFDLKTGDKGKSCAFNALNGYLGTDGSVFVRSPWNQKSDDLAQAYDLATCDKVWSIPRPAGSLGQDDQDRRRTCPYLRRWDRTDVPGAAELGPLDST